MRCYQQARQVYNEKGWQLAEDHVNFIIGRQASVLGHKDDALGAFSKLLTDGQQYAKEQTKYIKEFVQMWQQVHGDTVNDSAILPVPLIKDETLELELRKEVVVSLRTGLKLCTEYKAPLCSISVHGESKDARSTGAPCIHLRNLPRTEHFVRCWVLVHRRLRPMQRLTGKNSRAHCSLKR